MTKIIKEQKNKIVETLTLVVDKELEEIVNTDPKLKGFIRKRFENVEQTIALATNLEYLPINRIRKIYGKYKKVMNEYYPKEVEEDKRKIVERLAILMENNLNHNRF